MIVNIYHAKNLISSYQYLIKNNTLFIKSKERYIENNGWLVDKNRKPVPYKILRNKTDFGSANCTLCSAVGRNSEGTVNCNECVWSVTSKNKNGLLYCQNDNAFKMYEEMDFDKFNKLLLRRITLLKKAIKLSEEQNENT